jgi:hypothetical protein
VFHRYMKKSLLSYEEYYEVFFLEREGIWKFIRYITTLWKWIFV